ncbi:hypothetical protein HDU76_001949 [Blyttiomyces sp. JEL0837]|nr:hypothetical protein HDU76_001949 [Blyttiomyces sp. JEL0837]
MSSFTKEDYEPQHRTRQHGHIEDVIAAGGKVTEIQQHERNENLNVIVKLADSEDEMKFTNVKPEKIAELREKFPEIGEPAMTDLDDLKKREHPTKFIEMIKEPGATIVDWHPRKGGNYTVHVQTSDGQKHAYSQISEAHMQEFIKDFEPGSSGNLESAEE